MKPVSRNQFGTADPSTQCAVTNNTTLPAVVVIPTTSTNDDGTGAIQVYDQNLEVLPLAEGGYTIDIGSTGTVTLNQTYTDPTTGKPEPAIAYDLLISDSVWYFPLANLGVLQNFMAKPPVYPPQTATADTQSSIANAAAFCQAIEANPTSGLATAYQAAMQGTQDTVNSNLNSGPQPANSVSNTIESGVNAFFQSTKQYQNVTLANLVAVQSYYKAFPFVWGQYGKVTYYLYTSNGTATSFAGTLSLAPPTTINLTLPNGGYTCTFTPALNPSDTTTVAVDTSKAMTLTYGNWVFVNSLTQDIPDVAVRGTFQLQSFFTHVQTDTNIIPVITGSVYGNTCIGFDSPQLSNDSSSTFWNSLFHPQNSAQIFQSIMTIGGALMFLHFIGTTLYGIGKWAKGLASSSKPATIEDLQKQIGDLTDALNAKIDTAVRQISAGNEAPAANPADAMSSIAEDSTVVLDNLNAGSVINSLDAQASSVESLAAFESEMSSAQLQQLESAATGIQNSNSAIQNANPSELGEVVSQQQAALPEIQENISNLSESLSSELSQQAKQDIADNTDLVNELQEAMENAEESAKSAPTDDDPPAEDPIMPE